MLLSINSLLSLNAIYIASHTHIDPVFLFAMLSALQTVLHRHGPHRNQQRCNPQRVTHRTHHAPAQPSTSRTSACACPQRSGIGASNQSVPHPVDRLARAPRAIKSADEHDTMDALCKWTDRRARRKRAARLGATSDGKEEDTGGMRSRVQHTRPRSARGVQQMRRSR
jgi:hypothetical protein